MFQELHWQPTIGDPTLIGWITVFAYFITGISCFVVAQKQTGTIATFWVILSFILIVFGVNKQLDLQTLITEFGKVTTKSIGIYQYRRLLQISFMVLIFISLVLCLKYFWKFIMQSPKTLLLPFIGLIFLSAFIMVRALSFHHFDLFINQNNFGVRNNVILELGGIAIIFISTLLPQDNT